VSDLGEDKLTEVLSTKAKQQNGLLCNLPVCL